MFRRIFPSPRLAIYLAKTFFTRSLAVLAGLVLILMMLDLLGESGKILAQPGNGDAELWRYASLRVPQLIARFMPFSVLLGTLITLTTLNQNSEIVSMKAAGISAHQIIAPLIAASFGIAVASFAFNERIVTRATTQLNAWSSVNYGAIPPETDIQTDVWVRQGDDLILARQVRGSGADTRLLNVTFYQRDNGILNQVIEAKSATPQNGAWRLVDARIFDVARAVTEDRPEMMAGAGISPDQFSLASVNPNQEDMAQLARSIEELKLSGRETRSLEANFWHKLSGPLASVLMPLLAAVAAFGLARSGQVFVRAVIGMALGFIFFVADNFALAMGNLGAYPPWLAAWGPFFLFLLIGETVLVRTEE